MNVIILVNDLFGKNIYLAFISIWYFSFPLLVKLSSNFLLIKQLSRAFT